MDESGVSTPCELPAGHFSSLSSSTSSSASSSSSSSSSSLSSSSRCRSLLSFASPASAVREEVEAARRAEIGELRDGGGDSAARAEPVGDITRCTTAPAAGELDSACSAPCESLERTRFLVVLRGESWAAAVLLSDGERLRKLDDSTLGDESECRSRRGGGDGDVAESCLALSGRGSTAGDIDIADRRDTQPLLQA